MAFHFTLTVEEAADVYKLGRSSAYRAVERGQLESITQGRRRLVLAVPLLRALGWDERNLLPVLRRQPLVLTVAQTAKILRVSPDLVLDEIASGAIPAQRFGHRTLGPRAGELARRDVPTCRLDDRLQDVRRFVRDAGWEMCIVVNEQRVVLGRLGRGALAREDDASVEEAMAPGPATVRPSIPLELITKRMQEKQLSSYLITTPDGRLVGLLRREDAEGELAASVNKS